MDDARIQKLSQQLGIPFFIEGLSDLLYLTGLSLSKGRLLVKEGESILFVDGRYYEKAKKSAPCAVMMWDEQKKVSEKEIGFDSMTVSYDGYLRLKKGFPGVDWQAVPNPVKELRVVKEAREIAALKKAAAVTWKGYERVVEMLHEGVSEEELSLEFEFFCRKQGASGLSFEPIIAFGENGAYPHYRAGKSRLKKGQMVLIDVGAVVDQYHGDMTRVVHFGEPDEKVLRFEKLVRGAEKKALKAIRPGVRLGELDEIVQDEFDKANVKQLYTHSLGHGIGLETHEFPKIRFDSDDKDVILKPGMVFTIEPGLYQPGVGGVRWEDTVVVTETGYENFYAEF